MSEEYVECPKCGEYAYQIWCEKCGYTKGRDFEVDNSE